MNADFVARRHTLMQHVATDVVALVSGANMEYFFGLHVHLSERPTLGFITRQGVALILPKLEASKLEAHPIAGVQVFAWSDAEGYTRAFAEAVNALKLNDGATLGVDGMTMRVFEWLALQEAGVSPRTTRDVGQTLLLVRAVKTADEVQAIQNAIAISEQALANTLSWVRVGMSEADILQKLVQEQQALGAEGVPFSPIVLIGENSALPHGISGTRTLKEGDILLIDFGCRKEGYPSDITRTFVIGTPSEQVRHMHDTVRAANEAARAIARAGVTCAQVDEAARAVIEQAGLGAYFTHRTGHGLGLEVHELPNIAPNNDTVLQEGMVFTIEPGVYVSGVGGVRIEDDVVITADGCQSLTTYRRDFAL
jgi:Xaa-Pro dipeptidase